MDERATAPGAPARVANAATVGVGPDGFTYVANGPDADLHQFLDAYLASCLTAPPNHPGVSASPIRLAHMLQSAVAQTSIALEGRQPAVLRAALERLAWDSNHEDAGQGDGWSVIARPMLDLIAHLCEKLDRSEAAVAPTDMDAIVQPLLSSRWLLWYCWYSIVPRAERTLREHALTEARRRLYWSLADHIRLSGAYATMDPEEKRVPDRLDALTGRIPTGTVCAGEPWTNLALADIAALPAADQAAWNAFLTHALTATAATPSKTWLRRAETHLVNLGRPVVEEQLVRWFACACQAHPYPPHPRNATTLRGLVWCCMLQPSDNLIRAIGHLAAAMLKKIPGIGARSTKVGNACLYALSVIPGQESVAQLARLRLRVKGPTTQEAAQRALAAAATREGLAQDEVEELVVPTFGLDEHGQLHEQLGEHSVTIASGDGGHVTWRWQSAGGTVQTSVPAQVKDRHAPELKALKAMVEELRRTLAMQRTRLEGLFLRDRSWTPPIWRERYLDHPLLAALCRRLIWQFDAGERSTLGIWYRGRLVTVAGEPLDWLDEATTVRLWHPIDADPQVVLRWRLWLEEHQVAQPYKQAHREVYLLTAAERATATYSNRFAAHRLRQDGFYALCQERGWRYRVQGGFDSGDRGVARRTLSYDGLQAEFWVLAEGRADAPLSGAGLFLTVPTDRVRFVGADGAPRPLAVIPAIIFSEIMREIDLFVSVCSVGNDPTWQDRGEDGTGDPSWQHYAFGDLLATAATRRDVLERLVPRLRIADRCRIEGRFLIVRGDLRTYKIHIGSGNILMEPNDQYLCIVPGRRHTQETTERVFLPFEGDATLSLILSKAFMLADDAAIKDHTILQQIKRS